MALERRKRDVNYDSCGLHCCDMSSGVVDGYVKTHDAGRRPEDDGRDTTDFWQSHTSTRQLRRPHPGIDSRNYMRCSLSSCTEPATVSRYMPRLLLTL